MNVVYALGSRLIDAYARLRDRLSPGWLEKNKSKLVETKLSLYVFSSSKIGLTGLALVTVTLFLAIFGPFIAWEPYDVYPVLSNPDLAGKLPHPPCLGNCEGLPPAGTDQYGRDVLSLVIRGFRISLVMSVIIVVTSAVLGVVLGLVSGYFGGAVDEAIMRFTDMMLAFPGLILAIAFSLTLRLSLRDFMMSNPAFTGLVASMFALDPRDAPNLANLLSVFLALILVWWPPYARVVRGSVLTVKEQGFIEAARALGLSTRKVLFRHVLPNIMSPLLVMVTFDFATATLSSAALSFLGLGPQPPVPDLGLIISQAGQFFPERSWWIVVEAGTALLLISLGWNLVGDALRDVFDPKTRRSIELKAKIEVRP
ncbi:ABC transporter permease [Thermofilum pendens]|uniref:ABC transporter permease n=1 Tax=Thermofilum pendens TaxID=2269 RepID=UPI00069995A5|nr:ABC transporter permease [Thermofilum pendens]